MTAKLDGRVLRKLRVRKVLYFKSAMTKDDADAEEQRKQRAAARAGWPIRVASLEDPCDDDLSATTTVEERIGMVWRLTLDAWASSGRPLPSYRRSEMPGRVTALRDE